MMLQQTMDDESDCFLTKQPEMIKGEMRPYQLDGLNWLIQLKKYENIIY